MTDDFKGLVITPGDPGYDEARAVFNGLIDHLPERIMKCSDAADAAAAIRTAVDAGLPLSSTAVGTG
jgi:hypothetical protein